MMRYLAYPSSCTRLFFAVWLAAGALFLWLTPAYAQPYTDYFGNINPACTAVPHWMVTSKIVSCVTGTVRIVALNFWNHFSLAMQDTITVIFVFYVLFFGIRVFAGLEDIRKDSMIFITKFAMVLGIIYYMAAFFDAPSAIMSYATSLVVGQWSPWAAFDAYLVSLFGFGPTADLFNGLIGMIFSALSSSVTGVLVFILGLMAMITTLYFTFRAMFTYLASIILVYFLLILSPLILPLALFDSTKRYTEKWLEYLIAGIVHPVLLFAFLYMFNGVITYMLDWFVNGIFGGNDFTQYYRANRNFFSNLITADPATIKMLEGTLNSTVGRSALQSFVSPAMSQAVELNPVSAFALDFGPNQVWGLQLMVFGFLGIFIVAYLMLSMLNYLPEVADAIVGIATGLGNEGGRMVSDLKHAISKMKGASG